MRWKIIVVNAGIVLVVGLLSYVLLAASLGDVVANPSKRKIEVAQALRAASAQLFSRKISSTVAHAFSARRSTPFLAVKTTPAACGRAVARLGKTYALPFTSCSPTERATLTAQPWRRSRS